MTDLVFLDSDNHVLTTSLIVAETFEKEHKHVLEAIRNLLPDLPKDFSGPNFRPTSTEVAQPNGGVRSVPMYNLTRDGFSLLVMGFTGEKALQWKVKYIEAFNTMEAELLKQVEKPKKPQALPPTALSDAATIFGVLYEGNQLALALDKIFVREHGYSALKTAEVQLIAPQQQQLYTPTELGKSTTPILSPIKVNKILASLGWQIKTAVGWEAVGSGLSHAVYLDTGKAHSDGTPIRQLKWTADAIFAIQAYINE